MNCVPGNIVRDRNGKVVRYACPFSYRHFHTEREQYEFTLALMQEQGSCLSFAQRKEMYLDRNK